ncbi:MAG: hypothetical protein DWQ44_09670 [Bacteroidetes bacterium]|nr:MAG: hypothetical protein DWQ33_09945 [Bacteroidota bacterium]REK06551.1 MAG: hypothetical protein DWQ39_03460 [Bacteroidota bacterium]REK33317.1 MAG: hypothetical protein DWQ44_09670 [Bacteroidota bacterium]REK49717.1 MAG: hypothetical protein DWQ48_06225 [Bacteroidota bacterium]
MKRFILLVLLFPAIANSQSFEKGNIIISAGIDLGMYGTVAEDPVNAIKNTDGALSTVIPIGVEYGLTDNIGAGIQFRPNKYFSNEDTSTASNFDASLMLNYHFLRTENFNIHIGIKYGLSGFKYDNKINQEQFKGDGAHFQVDVAANFFPWEHIGFFAHLAYNQLRYKDGRIEDTNGKLHDYELYLNGASVGVGLQVKF